MVFMICSRTGKRIMMRMPLVSVNISITLAMNPVIIPIINMINSVFSTYSPCQSFSTQYKRINAGMIPRIKLDSGSTFIVIVVAGYKRLY